MSARKRARFLGSTIILASLASACGGGDGSGTPVAPVALVARITAPSTAALTCDLSVSVAYSAASSSGAITSWQWLDESGETLGRSASVDRTFTEEGVVVTTVRVWSTDGASNQTTHSVEIGPPTGCVRAVAAGPSTLSFVPGTVVEGVYSAEGSVGDVEEYAWELNGTVLSDEPVLTLLYDEAGTFDLELLVTGLGLQSRTDLRTVVVPRRACAPEDRSARMALYSEDRSDGVAIHLMDGDGVVSGPVVGVERVPSFQTLGVEPCGPGIVHSRSPDRGNGPDLYVVNRDGSGLALIDDTPGVQSGASWGVTGWIAYTDDRRWTFSSDELALVRPDGTGKFYAAGEFDESDRNFNGFHASWDPTGTKIALGSVSLDRREGPDRIVIYSALFGGSPTFEPLLTEEQVREGYAAEGVAEGVGGVAWSTDGQWIAHGTLVANEVTIVISRTDGSGEVRILAPGRNPSWSPDSQRVVFERQVEAAPERPFGNRHIFIISIDGGESVDLSAKTLNETTDATPSWVR